MGKDADEMSTGCGKGVPSRGPGHRRSLGCLSHPEISPQYLCPYSPLCQGPSQERTRTIRRPLDERQKRHQKRRSQGERDHLRT